ncbi:anthranilate synthase component I family protein [Niabella terrae]
MNWLRRFDTFSFLDSAGYTVGSGELLAGAGVKRCFRSGATDALEGLQSFIDQQPSWLFGHLSYDLHTTDKPFGPMHRDQTGFEHLLFFEPEVLLELAEDRLRISAADPQNVYEQILASNCSSQPPVWKTEIKPRISRAAYLDIIARLQDHIRRGDCYEINFCQEFFAEADRVDPIYLYQELTRISPNPFSGLYRNGDSWLVCASPERFLKKTGDRIISQPIKGTLSRLDPQADPAQEQQLLLQSAKDRAENVMVVDLVRNDLSRVCVEGSVAVEELYGIYSFPQVHQMISTVAGRLKPGTRLADTLQACFPMGSMTGAPKVSVMRLIREYERSNRGLFSGTIGYIRPDGDYDFNVVIRSIFYEAANRYLSFQTGGGITIYSDPAAEWEECRLKARAIREVLGC